MTEQNLESATAKEIVAALAAVDAVPDENFWRHDGICEAADQLIVDPQSWWIYCFCRQRAWARRPPSTPTATTRR